MPKMKKATQFAWPPEDSIDVTPNPDLNARELLLLEALPAEHWPALCGTERDRRFLAAGGTVGGRLDTFPRDSTAT